MQTILVSIQNARDNTEDLYDDIKHITYVFYQICSLLTIPSFLEGNWHKFSSPHPFVLQNQYIHMHISLRAEILYINKKLTSDRKHIVTSYPVRYPSVIRWSQLTSCAQWRQFGADAIMQDANFGFSQCHYKLWSKFFLVNVFYIKKFSVQKVLM